MQIRVGRVKDRFTVEGTTLVDPATGSVQPSGLTGWVLKMSEEFGNSISTVDAVAGTVKFRSGGPTWGTWYPGTSSMPDPHTNNPGREVEYYATSAVTLSGSSSLLLTSSHVSQGGLAYTSGMVNSNPSYNFTYGFIEGRMRMGKVGGTWPAFWLIPASYAWPPEVDIIEQFGTQTAATLTTWHNSTPTPATYNLQTWGGDCGTYHTYGVRWTSTALTFYFDGTQVAQETDVSAVPQESMYVVMNQAVDSFQTINNAGMPTSFEVDYVRVWQ